MTHEDQIAGATAYEELHVPALFQEWVDPVLDAAGVQPGHHVLDIACGTGILARSALERVGDRGAVTGVDPNPGMLTVARRIEPAVMWKEGVAESLPLPDESVDAVVSQFGMMFFTDRVEAAREMLRVLREDGRLAVAVWDALENQPAYDLEVKLLEEMAGAEAADALRAPFVLGDPTELAGIFEAAGAENVTVSSQTGTAHFPDIRTLVGADLRGWLPIMGVDLPEDRIERILTEAERVMSRFVTPDGTVVFDSPAHIVSARRASA